MEINEVDVQAAISGFELLGQIKRGLQGAEAVLAVVGNARQVLRETNAQTEAARTERETAGQAKAQSLVADAEANARRIAVQAEQRVAALDEQASKLREDMSRLDTEIAAKRTELASLQRKIESITATLRN